MRGRARSTCGMRGGGGRGRQLTRVRRPTWCQVAARTHLNGRRGGKGLQGRDRCDTGGRQMVPTAATETLESAASSPAIPVAVPTAETTSPAQQARRDDRVDEEAEHPEAVIKRLASTWHR
ncbi:hypothetical protein MRX96_032669 [Rhipicephalus microplus]